MPKKKKESEKEEETEELVVEEESEEESELEEEVSDSEINIQNLEFHQFMELQNSVISGSPILERIAGSAPRPIFVNSSPRSGTGSNSTESSDSGYTAGISENEEKKYFSEQGIENNPERIDLEKVGRNEFREEINQERFFMQSEPKIESRSPERIERVSRFDVEREISRNPFERPEEKYEKYRPKSPKH